MSVMRYLDHLVYVHIMMCSYNVYESTVSSCECGCLCFKHNIRYVYLILILENKCVIFK